MSNFFYSAAGPLIPDGCYYQAIYHYKILSGYWPDCNLTFSRPRVDYDGTRTQSFVIALVGGMGTDHRRNVNVVKHYIRWAHTLAQSNFDIASLPLPEKPQVDAPLPKGYSFSPVYPTPFSLSNGARATIRYRLPRESEVEVKIYDVLGHEVKTLAQRSQSPGDYVITWDGTTAAGAPVASGIYLVHLRAWIYEKTRKILVIR